MANIPKELLDKILNIGYDEIVNAHEKFEYKPILDSRWAIGGSNSMADINHCRNGMSGMSGCDATNIKKDSEKIESQKKCKFYKKSSCNNECLFETFGEFCWCVDAQQDSKKG